MKKYVLVLSLFAFILALSCQHKIVPQPGNNGTGDTTAYNNVPCSPDTVYFKNEILPVILSNCAMSGCHDAVSKQDGVQLTDYGSILSTTKTVPFNVNKSKLYEAITETDPDDVMPPAGPLPADVIAKIRKWIEQGALNNSCMSCDTVGTMSFSNHVQPVINAYCKGCHNGPGGGGGVDLSNYNGVSTAANNGSLTGSIQHLSGYSAMPKNGNKLSTCDITTIVKWVQDGAKNN